jgi:hypothetical protein
VGEYEQIAKRIQTYDLGRCFGVRIEDGEEKMIKYQITWVGANGEDVLSDPMTLDDTIDHMRSGHGTFRLIERVKTSPNCDEGKDK